MRVFGAIDRWLARCWLAYPQLARRLLDACALYLRHAPCATGQRSLLTFCMRSLLPALPLFADAVVSLSARPGVRMRCFQLGGAHQADILSEWLLLTGAWQPALTAYMLRSLLPGDTLVDVGANTGYFALLGAALVGSTGRVVAVEACPRTHERLLANLALIAVPLLASSDTRIGLDAGCTTKHASDGASNLAHSTVLLDRSLVSNRSG